MVRLTELRPGQECTVREIHGGWGLMRRLAELGIFRGVRVKVLSGGPWGGPVYLEIVPTGARCSIGHGAASRIMVDPDSIPENENSRNRHEDFLGRHGRRGWCFWKRDG